MEDLRKKQLEDKFKRIQKWVEIKKYLKKNWVKYLIIITLIVIFLFPNFVGDLFGAWFNKLAISFIKNITF